MPYRKTDQEVDDLLLKVMKANHPDLAAHKVTVQTVFAVAPRRKGTGEPKGPALRHHGYPALAVIARIPAKKRLRGSKDAELTLDGDRWPDLTDEEKWALLDHELEHLQVAKDKDGGPKLDDANRPKLKMRPHDCEVGAFFEVVKRNGRAAPESRAFEGAYREFTQLCFPWG